MDQYFIRKQYAAAQAQYNTYQTQESALSECARTMTWERGKEVLLERCTQLRQLMAAAWNKRDYYESKLLPVDASTR